MHGGLNERQQNVLNWVSRGCPDSIWPDSSQKVSAQALQSRGLIKITKRRGHWNAELTDKGRLHLANIGTSPLGHGGEAPEESGEILASPRTRGVPKIRTNCTDQLLEELAAHNNHLVKPVESVPHAVNWASRVSAARKSGKIPHTQQLRGKQTGYGYEIKLTDVPAWQLVELTPITVPAKLIRPHPVVAALQQHPRHMGLTKAVFSRALRIIQALVTASESHGHITALSPVPSTPPSRHRRQATPHFTITAQGERIDVLVLQELDHSKHIATEKERADAAKHTWMRIPRFDYTPANRLRFLLRGGTPYRGTEWADLDGRPLEDQLAEIIQEVDLRGEAAERNLRAEAQAEEAALQHREDALHNARAAYTHAYRVKQLEEQTGTWHQAKRLAEYVTAVRSRATSLPPGQERTGIEEWLGFAEAHLQQLFDTASVPTLPKPPPPSSADLAPFLVQQTFANRTFPHSQMRP